jgi:hypothetical protein
MTPIAQGNSGTIITAPFVANNRSPARVRCTGLSRGRRTIFPAQE